MTHQHAQEYPSDGASTPRLFGALSLNLVITIVEVTGGLASGSLSLVSDALHNLSDAVSIFISYVALRLARQPRSLRFTFGLKRAQVLAAVFNASVLLAVCAYLVREAYGRWGSPSPVAVNLMIPVAVVGLVANVAGTLLLRKGARANLNVRSSYLHLLSDAVSSAAVVAGGLVMRAWGFYWVDPLLTVLIALYVAKESLEIVWEATSVLLLSAPPDVSLPDVQARVESIPGVRNLHHVHYWRVDDRDTHFEAHVDVDDIPVKDTQVLAQRIEEELRHVGINHVTLQFEVDRCASKSLV